MPWASDCVDHLIAGDSLNVVGLSGSGRSRGLESIANLLKDIDVNTLLWRPNDVIDMTNRNMFRAISEFAQSAHYTALLIDDFGELLMTRRGRKLENYLFGEIYSRESNCKNSFVCVVVTHPRDREIIGPGSGLRERSRVAIAPGCQLGPLSFSDFGCTDVHDLIRLTGHNCHLLHTTAPNPSVRLRSIRTIAHRWLPRWIGQLDEAHQRRLSAILSRARPPRWRSDDADPVLMPLVVRDTSVNPAICSAMSCVQTDSIRTLLIGEPWPDRDFSSASRRFAARCGTDPNPLWVDNFLSDTTQLDYSKLVSFLDNVLGLLGSDVTLRILSRNWVNGRTVIPTQVLAELTGAGIKPSHKKRLEWRIYDRRHGVNLHRRELILGRRRVSFSLPPAQTVIGQSPSGNETDSSVSFASSSSSLDAWKKATPVY